MKKTLLFTLAAAGGGTSARWHTPEGGGFGSLEPFLVEPAGGCAFLMSKLKGGGSSFPSGGGHPPFGELFCLTINTVLRVRCAGLRTHRRC